ncbi:MAG: mercuric transporter MerT family protein [Hyphomicrobiaceae bacterium]
MVRLAADAKAPATGGLQARTAGLLSLGGLVAAIAAASCCVLPFALFVLGVSGAWIGNLTALAPYQPVFAAVAFGLLGCGFYLVYRKPRATCADGSWCARPGSLRSVKVGLWTATVLVVVALAFPRLASLFF